MRKSVILGAIVAVMAVPSMAWAGCGHTSGSYAVSCENGVKVYRHQAKDLRSVGLTATQANLEIAKMQQETARQKIAANRAIASQNAALRSRQLDNQRFLYRRATESRRFSNRSRYGHGGYYRSGFAVLDRVPTRGRGYRVKH